MRGEGPPASHRAARVLLGFGAFVAVGWGAGELWLEIVGSADLDAVREVAASRTETLTQAARVVTWAGSAFLLVPLALVCCALLVRAGRRVEALALALSLGGAMLLSDLVKLLVSRPRPPVEHLQAVTGSSFPSGHATQASAFWLSLVLVAAVAWSRVYLGVHYPADVVAGVLLGSGWAVFVWLSVRDAPPREVSSARPAAHRQAS